MFPESNSEEIVSCRLSGRLNTDVDWQIGSGKGEDSEEAITWIIKITYRNYKI